MAAPKVQTLAQIIADLNPAYATQAQLYNQKMGQIPIQQQAATAGLDTAKTNSFRDIRESAVGSGNIWSGAPIEEQQRYVGEKYLPALAGIEGQFQEQQFNLSKSIADLESEKRLRALDTRGDQKKTLNAYLEAERDRAFRLKMQREAQAVQARENAANRAAASARSSASGASASPKERVAGLLAQAAGKDGKVAPGDYNALKNQWVSAGYGSYKDFHDKFWQFANQKYWWDYR